MAVASAQATHVTPIKLTPTQLQQQLQTTDMTDAKSMKLDISYTTVDKKKLNNDDRNDCCYQSIG